MEEKDVSEGVERISKEDILGQDVSKRDTLYFKGLQAKQISFDQIKETAKIEVKVETNELSKIEEILNRHSINYSFYTIRYEFQRYIITIYGIDVYSYLYVAAIDKVLPKWME